jgi:uncharacterized protein YdhG (YjbR/CyaY superfamily)
MSSPVADWRVPDLEGKLAEVTAAGATAMGERLYAIIKASAPAYAPRTWYGMPAYAKNGKVVCFFRGGDKFKERYMTLGFKDAANLDEGRCGRSPSR